MRFSRSLLENEDIKRNIYQKGVSKSKKVLTDIFGLDFESKNANIVNSDENESKLNLDISFIFNDRKIAAKYYFDEDKDDMLNEILLITENEKEAIQLDNVSEDFISNINKIQDILEEKYELNFTPLDPEEEDMNIIAIESTSNSWKVIFNQDFHEGKIIASYKEGDHVIQIDILREHRIYID